MSYLKSKDGSIEASIKEMQKHIKDNAYQDMFKKELEKAGKGIGAMSDQEKKDFFNKIDKKYKGKNEEVKEAELPAGPDVDQMNAKKAANKDPKKGEKEPMKMNTESLERTLWKMAGDQLEEMKKKVQMKAQDVAPDNDSGDESEKEKKGKTLVGSKQTKVETEPKVDYVK